ncbi:MAG: stem cell self-renewal protein Piwi domain-containing protein [Symploca sp. SIO1C4]|uniref:Protein argonaute n=1 Tax=Symploca sp. SIO1C4 TaxID=2607765 RepID=A0A6B3NC92_9CYAN|nr:stem cell self-renewal protein Piwi domain-containing protein [Symploca sp. SIO1C4]
MSIFLNGFKVELSAPTFKAYVQELPNNQEVKPLREALGDEWFLHWREGVIYGIPKVTTPQKSFGQSIDVSCHDHLQLLTSRIADLLPDIFDKYKPLKRKPFIFLAQRKELVSEIIKTIKDLPDIVSSFKIVPKYILEPKIFELDYDEAGIGLFLQLKTRWQIQAPLSLLQNEGVELHGLYVVRRQCTLGQRRLVGRIERIHQQTVHLYESFDSLDHIHENEVFLEGSKVSFSRCLKAILGDQYKNFESVRAEQEGNLLIGTALEKTLKQMRDFLEKKSPLQIAPDLQAKIGDLIEVTNTREYQSVITVSPVEYCFDAARTKRSSCAWHGIDKYGPFSRTFFSKKTPEIIVFFPDTVQGTVENFLRELSDGISIKRKEINEYRDIEWKETSRYIGGFAKIFGLVNPNLRLHPIPWFQNTHKPPALVYKEEIARVLSNQDINPDAAIVVILDSHIRLPDSENPYLHSKAILLMTGIPVQAASLATISQQKSEQNIEFAFLTVSHDHPFSILDKSQLGVRVRKNDSGSPRKGVYVPQRGTIVQLGRYTRLLSTNSPNLIKRPSSPLPKPLLIHLHPQSTYYDLTYLSEQVLKFTSLSWKSTLPASNPVTIYYSKLIAGLLARLKNVREWSPAILNIKLRASKWFL